MSDSMRQSSINSESSLIEGVLLANADWGELSDLVELSLEFFPSIEYFMFK